MVQGGGGRAVWMREMLRYGEPEGAPGACFAWTWYSTKG